MSTVLVTGATGQIGAPLVGMLGDRGASVRAMVRREADAGAVDERSRAVIADFDAPSSLSEALAGVDALFLNTPSSEQAAERQMRCADLAVAAGVRRLVLLSQLAADETSPVRFLRWHAAVERHVHALAWEVVVLRPNLFLQGVLAMRESITERGVLGAPIGDARVSMIDIRDIAAVAATVLLDDGHAGATYTLTGPEPITHQQVATAIADASGRPVVFRDLGEDEFTTMLSGAFPPWQLAGLVEDYAHYRRGEAAAVDAAVSTVLGRPALGLTAFAQDYFSETP